MLDRAEQGPRPQPHTSGGRIPPPKGFRFYVDHILPIHELGPTMQQAIQESFSLPAADPQELFRQASRVLSTVSGHPALVLAPRPQGMRLKHIQFINLSDDGVLIVLVSQDNQVQTRFVRTETRYSQELLDRFSHYLNGVCQNLTLTESRQQILSRMGGEKNLVDRMISQGLSLRPPAWQE